MLLLIFLVVAGALIYVALSLVALWPMALLLAAAIIVAIWAK